MTEKLYYSDPFLYAFDAQIVDIASYHGKPALVLDRTAFFPEGGGQPGDEGSIEGVYVFDTRIENDDIYHVVQHTDGFAAGQHVRCEVNANKRFARMQAHSGEHVVSGIAHRLFGAENVGFHMDDTLMTVDFDKPLTKEVLAQVEREANACVYADVPVRAWFPDAETLKTLSYRSKIDGLMDVRIVTIEGVDNCACCAVHVRSTGQIGLIKILTAVSHRGGVRITLVCGVTAYEDYILKHTQTLRIADLLAAKHGETADAVEKLLEKEKNLKWQIGQKTEQMIDYIKANSVFASENAVFDLPGFNPEELKTAALALRTVCGGLCITISGDDSKGYYFAMSSDTVKATDFSKTVTSALGGSGGGRFDVVQGRLNAKKEEILRYFDTLKVN